MDLPELFKLAIQAQASDILITAGSPPIFRIHGQMTTTNAPRMGAEETKKYLFDVLRDDQVAKFEANKELDFSLTIDNTERFRANLFYSRGAVCGAFRLIANRIPSLAELGLPPVLEEFALQPQGLVLVTGPTGHGKSTTQAAMIDLINAQRRAHIVTIEDPIEFLHRSKRSVVDQREVGDDTLSFANALRHVLRQDPDVILVGEMRDLDSIQAALTAAETGHLVLATLHTNDCVQAVDRLVDVFPSHQQNQVRSQISLCLLGITAQRLLPTRDGKARVAAVEVLRNNSAVSNLIRDGKTHQLYTILETHAKDGMVTMDSALKALFLAGRVEHGVCRERMRNPALLDRL